ncbi:hypothetical protein CKO11_00870 [Rhodobacter sp. TJ_12]|uniref:hypothetical protein n=1 Tax=Rhodobacter sp. TJ_12 TaxID=2029399 RepID=UPI001CC11AC5|nr:hypothetical protein [Rhodobacter sp. TJ_12]MBZ4021013.1 hypothetical protein [Rhodobacter sp. TJ_12]
MITRYALFEGTIKEGQTEAFREAILTEVLPKWRAFPDALAVRICFEESRDDGAPSFPLILAISYPSLEAVDIALASAVRAESKEATESVLARYFDGRIHHHITTAHDTVIA